MFKKMLKRNNDTHKNVCSTSRKCKYECSMVFSCVQLHTKTCVLDCISPTKNTYTII